jgi:protein TonB
MERFYFTEAIGDRLGFAVMVACAMHVIIVLGVSFQREDKELAPPSLEITLAQHHTLEEVEDADFLAQHNQQASGSLAEKALLTTPTEADFAAPEINEVNPLPTAELTPPEPISTQQIITTIDNNALQEQPDEELLEQPEEVIDLPEGPDQLIHSEEIASLQAKLDYQRQAYAKRPRIHRLTSLATRESSDALYLHNWKTRIETIGNQNYPGEARLNRLYGDLRLLVVLRVDGSVQDIEILKSSGHKVLDDAAVRIVRLAEPFEPFPVSIREYADTLEIIRTWQFRRNRFSSQ